MFIRRFISLCLLFVMMAAGTAVPSTPIPRTSPEFNIKEPSGKQVLLSSFKGKVVMIEFFFLRSAECANLAQVMNKLAAELGPRGFQPVGIAFSAPTSEVNGPLLGSFADSNKLSYPVGLAQKEEVDRYFGREPRERLRIPQVVLIDRAGTIRAQSGDSRQLENEAYLRNMLETLLKEGAPAAGGNKK